MKTLFFIICIITYYTVSALAQPGNEKPDNLKDLTAGCIPSSASAELNVNNVRALIHAGGDMWWDLMNMPKYEVPINSGKTALFAGAIWLGGIDQFGQLRLSAQMFRSGGVDYWTGPLKTSGAEMATTTAETCAGYDRIFTITSQEVETFRDWYNASPVVQNQLYPDYTVPDIIKEWPAHGDISQNYDYYLAPFFDANNDGAYNSDDGDYPYYDFDNQLPCNDPLGSWVPHLRGDQTLWWVFNDNGNIHTETGGNAIGLEIRAQAYAYSTNDELDNMTFYEYEIINRGTYTLDSTFFGIWTDADLGYPYDDYIGCDVGRGLGYLYNGDEMDGDGNINTYGSHPPAIGIDLFEGPFQDPDGIDNPSSYDSETGQLLCDSNIMNGNINGLFFGDGIPDNERWGMRRFIYFNNSTGPMGNPLTAAQYYYYLLGYWNDGTHIQYGGTGGPDADFMFPGSPNTDPCGWGTGGVPQADWSEETEGNVPGDRRFVQSSGPFTMEPGSVNRVTIGAVWARTPFGTAYNSVQELKRADDKAQLMFENCFREIDGPDAPELTAIELDKEIILQIWNNPVSNNYLEKYKMKGNIVCPLDEDGNITDCDKYYTFQGYQIFQLKNAGVSLDDLYNTDSAKLVFQTDIKDNVAQLVNYMWAKELHANIPQEMVYGENNGLTHSVRITKDLFAEYSDNLLVNNIP
ncbi:MAG: T9SS C-terminal target domain-containing protein, partial [Bacteroidia bacterium]|nr:T9SS C-terminal target domain-containing protein [Bacteroidia bacterium]